MKFKKLSLTLLTLGFCTALAGGALAADTSTTTTTTTLPTTTTTTTAPTLEVVTTAPTVEVTVPKQRAYPGTIKAIDVAGKKITVVSANKKVTKEITLDEKTKYVYKGKAIDPAKIGAGSIVVVTVQITGEKGKEVYKAVKVQVNTLTEKKKPVKKPVKKPIKKEPVKREPVKKEPVKKEPVKKEPIKKEPVKKPVTKAPAKTPAKDTKAPTKDTKTPVKDTKEPTKDTKTPERDTKAPGQGNDKSPKK